MEGGHPASVQCETAHRYHKAIYFAESKRSGYAGKYRQIAIYLFAKDHVVKTTISILVPVEHEILNWAIHSDFFGETENNFPSHWSSWDRTGVLTPTGLTIDWETPHIAAYAAFILLRLQGLYKDAKDKYATAAKDLEKRIRRALESQDPSRHRLLSRAAGR
jgi:hypothetical protein